MSVEMKGCSWMLIKLKYIQVCEEKRMEFCGMMMMSFFWRQFTTSLINVEMRNVECLQKNSTRWYTFQARSGRISLFIFRLWLNECENMGFLGLFALLTWARKLLYIDLFPIKFITFSKFHILPRVASNQVILRSIKINDMWFILIFILLSFGNSRFFRLLNETSK